VCRTSSVDVFGSVVRKAFEGSHQVAEGFIEISGDFVLGRPSAGLFGYEITVQTYDLYHRSLR
jgi:hypothetical protein